ncbi:MAG: response regulator [Rhodoferax sp.]
MKLLVVEDSEMIRSRLLGLLAGIVGIESMDSAATLHQALACARRDLPTLVLLDLHLPDGMATGIIPALKALSAAMQIAMLTNDADAVTRNHCLRAGADWFFDKSTEIDAAIERVRQQAELSLLIHHP